MSKLIPIDSPQVMVVAVNGVSRYKGQFEGRYEGWDAIVNEFVYSCAPNDGVHHRRPNASLIAFYRTEDPQALTHWAKVRKITEDKKSRRYYLESLHKMPHAVKKGRIPPNMSGGYRPISFDNLFKIYSLDELYAGHQILPENTQNILKEKIDRCWYNVREAITDSNLNGALEVKNRMLKDGEEFCLIKDKDATEHLIVQMFGKTTAGFHVNIFQSTSFPKTLNAAEINGRCVLLIEPVLFEYLIPSVIDLKPLIKVTENDSEYMDVSLTFKTAFFDLTSSLSTSLTETLAMKIISRFLKEEYLNEFPVKADKPFELIRVPGHEKLEERPACFGFNTFSKKERMHFASGLDLPINCDNCVVKISCKEKTNTNHKRWRTEITCYGTLPINTIAECRKTCPYSTRCYNASVLWNLDQEMKKAEERPDCYGLFAADADARHKAVESTVPADCQTCGVNDTCSVVTKEDLRIHMHKIKLIENKR